MWEEEKIEWGTYLINIESKPKQKSTDFRMEEKL